MVLEVERTRGERPMREVEPAKPSGGQVGTGDGAGAGGAAAPRAFPVDRVRADFPQLATPMRGQPLCYLDSAATSLKPRVVIDRLAGFYARECANVHRGVYVLSEQATAAFEAARAEVARYLGAPAPGEVVFCRGATEAINLVAQSFARPRLAEGDEVLVSALEHHANIVPWQLVCKERGARLRVIPVDDRGDLVLEQAEHLIGPQTCLLAVTAVSNALGTVTPLDELIRLAKAAGVPVLVDGAQAVQHGPVDVRALGCDFYVFSGHKALGPTGVGCLWAKAEVLAAMPPWQGGGDMIEEVRFSGTTFAAPPHRFEAGTPPIAEAIALAEGLRYLAAHAGPALAAHEAALLARAEAGLLAIDGTRLIGRPRRRQGALSFVVDGAHPHDLATILDGRGVAIRAGHHCAQPVMERFAVPATARLSVALYSCEAEIDALVEGVAEAAALLR